MYFCEQGKWNSEKKTYLRVTGSEWNNTTKQWDDVFGRSPFQSIPACFWWAIVTATTVGYGDSFPTTPLGKAIAGISMVWSLCVLALPIGVIGNNFSAVWEEYDKEKEKDQWNAIKEQMMLKRSIAWGDPLHYSRRVLLEVWHDPGLSDDDQAEFMGEVDFTLYMPVKEAVTSGKLTEVLTSNYEKARRRVRGTLTFEYTWKPAVEQSGSDALLSGTLEVVVVAGEDLISIDWKGSCSSDPYCVVIAYPQSPPVDGKVEPVWYRTNTDWDTSNPKWNFRVSFDVHWTQAGTAHCMQADMRQIGSDPGVENSVIAAPPRKSMLVNSSQPSQQNVTPELTEKEKIATIQKTVPELQEEIFQLQRIAVPQIRSQIVDVQQDLALIASTLRKRAASSNGAPDVNRSNAATSSNFSTSAARAPDASPWTAASMDSDDSP